MRYFIGSILFIFTCFNFSACDKGKRIDIPFQTFVTIPAGLNTGLSYHFPIRDIIGVQLDELTDAQPAYVTLSIDYGESNMDFVEQAFFLALEDGGNKREMAYQTDLPFTNSSSVQLYPSIYNMKDHITQAEFDMELKLIFRAFPSTETRLRIDFGVQGLTGE